MVSLKHTYTKAKTLKNTTRYTTTKKKIYLFKLKVEKDKVKRYAITRKMLPKHT